MKPLVTVIRAKKGGENVSKIPGWMEICWSPQGIRQEGSTTAGLKLCMAVSRWPVKKTSLYSICNQLKQNIRQAGVIIWHVFESNRKQSNQIFARALARYSRHQPRRRWWGMGSVEEHWASVAWWTSKRVPPSPDTAPPNTVAPGRPQSKNTRCEACLVSSPAHDGCIEAKGARQ